VATPEARQWLNALGGGDNVLQLNCVAMTRIRLQLADGKALSECDLKALGCQGVSQLEGGVWHLLVGDRAASLSEALEGLVNRSEVSAKV
jgi:PTS system N-acetylglucosamine-specific IIC component